MSEMEMVMERLAPRNPWLAPWFLRDPAKDDPDSGPFRRMETPEGFVMKRGLIIDGRLDEVGLGVYLARQLGPRLTGLEQCLAPKEKWRRGFLAALIAALFPEKSGETSLRILNAMASSNPWKALDDPEAIDIADADEYLAFVRENMEPDYRYFSSGPLRSLKSTGQTDPEARMRSDMSRLMRFVCWHTAHFNTFVHAMSAWMFWDSKKTGIIFLPHRFGWLKAFDRVLWYSFAHCGAPGYSIEYLGVGAHLLAEVDEKMPLAEPRVAAGVKMVKDYLERKGIISPENREQQEELA